MWWKEVLREMRTSGWMRKDGDDGDDVMRKGGVDGRLIQSWVRQSRWRWGGRGSLESGRWEQEKEKHHKERHVGCSKMDGPSSLEDPWSDTPSVVVVAVGGDDSPIVGPWRLHKGCS